MYAAPVLPAASSAQVLGACQAKGPSAQRAGLLRGALPRPVSSSGLFGGATVPDVTITARFFAYPLDSRAKWKLGGTC